MAINIKFDLTGNPEPPTIILAKRNGDKLGQLDVNAESIELSDKFNDASEMSFTLNKYVEGKLTPLWDKVVDFKLVWCKEWDLWFEIKVELDEDTETVKTVFCTQLGQAELSQINLYNIEINTEKDIERDDYKICILYDENNPESSILNRLLEKAPHYSIAYVDSTIANIQRSFSFDDTSIYDAFQEIAEEIGCLFVFHSNSDENGKINRTISVYDLQQNCLNSKCKHRGEFTDVCPKCEGTNIKYGYGDDTLIFVTSDELASEGIQLTTDADSVKNCFKLEAGDDLMTATVRNCNPNGTDYIWRFSDMTKEDMSEDLVNALNSYDDLYKDYYDNHESKLNSNSVSKYNALVKKYKGYYNTESTCLNCDYKDIFVGNCPSCGSSNILSGKNLQSISTTIKGYSDLMNAYYNAIDLELYLESSLMPTVEMSETTAKNQAALLTASALSPVAVNTQNVESISQSTADSAVLSMAKIIVKPTYKVEVKTSTLSSGKVWQGSFIITNYSDENDTAESATVKVTVNNNTETFIKQKIEKALNKENTDDYSVSGLFENDYNDFCNELKKYALNPLKSFYDACDSCLNILIDQGAGKKTENPDLYNNLYKPYYNKSSAITKEIKLREDEIAIIKGVWDKTDEENAKLITKGLQQYIEDCRNEIQKTLNFEDYIGKELWLEFCSYRRDDKYSNDNYISDGLSNSELFNKAREFYDAAEKEIYKSSELQHSISTTLNNLLKIDKFKPLIEFFKTGNWIRVWVDDKVFKLRLLEYNIDFGSFESISVEFSDVTKIKNGITDIKSIIDQASSMATNYSSVQRQADQGTKAKGTISQWFENGLNSALVQIKSNDSEEVTLTENGLLARSYNEITDTYSPEQLRITHNIMAYTDDDWETVKQAIGKHNYKAYDTTSKNIVDRVGYGMSAEFVTAGVVSGSQIIGGDIYSNNYVAGQSGSFIDLESGRFEFGGGKITFNGTELIVNPDNGVGLTEDEVASIADGRIRAANIDAKQITVNKITASQIDAKGLIAENISGTTITGKTISGGKISIGDNFRVNEYGVLTAVGVSLDGDITTTNDDGESATFSAGLTSYFSKNSNAGIEINYNEMRLYSAKDDHCSISFYGKDTDLKAYIDDEGIYKGDASILDWSGNADLRTIDLNYSIYNSDKNSLSVYISGTGSNIASLGNGSGAVRFASDAVQPSETNTMTLGSSNYKWSDIFAATGSINNSDRNAKDNIKSLTDVHEQFFMKLLPVSFTFKDGTSGRTHIGFISQDVESAMEELGMTSLDFAGFCKDIKTKPCVGRDGEEPDLDEDGNVQYIYSLRYGEFVALNSYMIQKLYQRVIDLENKLK